MIISQPKTSFLGVVFDVDHDFEGPRAPKAHLDTVNTNLSHHPRPPPYAAGYPARFYLLYIVYSGWRLLLDLGLFRGTAKKKLCDV